MTDIIPTLRERADSYDMSGPSSAHTSKLLREAADEIERLCALVSHYRGAMVSIADIVTASRELTNFSK